MMKQMIAVAIEPVFLMLMLNPALTAALSSTLDSSASS